MTPRANKVLVLSLVFPPEAVSTSQLFGELVEDLVRQGREVTVITTKPHFHPETAAAQRRGLKPSWGGLLARSTFRGATVIHTAMPLKGKSVPMRIAGWIGFHVLSVLASRSAGRVDVILAPSPPLTVGLVAWLIGRLKRAPYIYNVQELYPDAAVAVGLMKPGALLAMLYRLEHFIYARAFAVTAIARGMRERIMSKGFDGSKIRLVPNFVDLGDMVERPKDNPFAWEHALHDKFVVMYAGNIGRFQGLEVVLDAAALTADRVDIIYAIVGEGASRDELHATAMSRGLRNVLFVPQQPYARVPDIYGSCDLALVPLLRSVVDDAVPSKVYRIMASRRAVLAVAEPMSDLAKIVTEANAGWVVDPGDGAALAAVIRAAADERRRFDARDYVERNVERSVVTAAYGALLDEAAAVRR